MVLETPPSTAKLLNQDGTISRPWNEWLTRLASVLNNVETKTVVTQVSPEQTTSITYIKGD